MEARSKEEESGDEGVIKRNDQQRGGGERQMPTRGLVRNSDISASTAALMVPFDDNLVIRSSRNVRSRRKSQRVLIARINEETEDDEDGVALNCEIPDRRAVFAEMKNPVKVDDSVSTQFRETEEYFDKGLASFYGAEYASKSAMWSRSSSVDLDDPDADIDDLQRELSEAEDEFLLSLSSSTSSVTGWPQSPQRDEQSFTDLFEEQPHEEGFVQTDAYSDDTKNVVQLETSTMAQPDQTTRQDNDVDGENLVVGKEIQEKNLSEQQEETISELVEEQPISDSCVDETTASSKVVGDDVENETFQKHHLSEIETYEEPEFAAVIVDNHPLAYRHDMTTALSKDGDDDVAVEKEIQENESSQQENVTSETEACEETYCAAVIVDKQPLANSHVEVTTALSKDGDNDVAVEKEIQQNSSSQEEETECTACIVDEQHLADSQAVETTAPESVERDVAVDEKIQLNETSQYQEATYEETECMTVIVDERSIDESRVDDTSALSKYVDDNVAVGKEPEEKNLSEHDMAGPVSESSKPKECNACGFVRPIQDEPKKSKQQPAVLEDDNETELTANLSINQDVIPENPCGKVMADPFLVIANDLALAAEELLESMTTRKMPCPGKVNSPKGTDFVSDRKVKDGSEAPKQQPAASEDCNEAKFTPGLPFGDQKMIPENSRDTAIAESLLAIANDLSSEAEVLLEMMSKSLILITN